VAELADLLREVADGMPSAIDADLTVVPPPDERSFGVLSFPGQHIIVADVAVEWVRSWVPEGDLGAPLGPPFLTVLAAVTGRAIGTTDALLVARGHGRRRGLELTETTDSDHPRLARARRQRTEVRAWECPGGLLVLGRGVAGRWEVAVEVDAALRGFGFGRGLFGAALGLVDPGEPVWAQVAPGNAASLRALLAVGYRPVGAEVLLEPWTDLADQEPIEWFGPHVPATEVDWDDEDIDGDAAEDIAGGAEHVAVATEDVEVDVMVADETGTHAEPEVGRHGRPEESLPGEPTVSAPTPSETTPSDTAADRKPRPVTSVVPTPATAAEVAAAEAEAEGELAADEDTELAERDDPRT
jgi:hypothetical protein